MARLLDEHEREHGWSGSALPHDGADDSTYEERLDRDLRWALDEGSRYFEEKSAVHEALRKITRRLDELGVPYAVADGMALFAHGFRRFTEDVDILVSRDALKTIHKKLLGLGYRHPFNGSKNLKDAELGVRIEFLIAGQYPGDGKPKPVEFPDPARSAVERDGIRYLDLPVLIELKLASGMTNQERIKDLADVQELIKLLDLPAEFAEQLNPYVQARYGELWRAVRGTPKRYVMLWRNKPLTAGAKSLGDMIQTLRAAADSLAEMQADGVTLDPDGGTADDYAHLVTTDPAIARKYGMHPEDEFFDLGGDEGDEGDERDERDERDDGNR